MDPPEYGSVANELLPRLMFKLGKFLTYDNERLAQLCQMLDDVEKYKSVSDDAIMKQLFTGTIAQLVYDAYSMADVQSQQKSVNEIINEHNTNIRMPTNALNMLLSHIWEELQSAKFSSDIVTSASECITCTLTEFNVIKNSVASWLSSNKEQYVIL